MNSRVASFPAASGRTRRVAFRALLATFLGRIAVGLGEADRLHRERRYLDEMDDRTLRDIGVTRADVEVELRRPVGWTALFFRG